jgi:rare lipoprotein A
MAAMKSLKNAACRLAVFLCILSIGGAAVSLGYEPATPIHWEPAQPSQLAPPSVSWEVIASWYGPRHQNKLTANGQRFNMYKNTLAHRTLPLGTRVRLVNLENGNSAEGIVNDRGPYVKGRDVDVSYAMAKQLGFVKKGVVKLDIEKM